MIKYLKYIPFIVLGTISASNSELDAEKINLPKNRINFLMRSSISGENNNEYSTISDSDDGSVELNTDKKGLNERLKKKIIELKDINSGLLHENSELKYKYKALLHKNIEFQNRNEEWEREYLKLGKSITYALDINKRCRRDIKSLENILLFLIGACVAISYICFLFEFYNLFKKTPESNPASETPLLQGVVA